MSDSYFHECIENGCFADAIEEYERLEVSATELEAKVDGLTSAVQHCLDLIKDLPRVDAQDLNSNIVYWELDDFDYRDLISTLEKALVDSRKQCS